MYSANDLFETLKQHGIQVSPAQERAIKERINKMLSYQPKIGVFGKTGVGKSSLCNALFGRELCPVSDVEACTRQPKDVLISMGEAGKGIVLVDVPGVGESRDRDNEYAKLYAKLLPELDVILWVLKADDRAFASDEEFYRNIVKHHIDDKKPFFFVLNQVDKIEPFREWNIETHTPSDAQQSNIIKKAADVANFFDVAASKVIPVSAEEKYNLAVLVDEFIRALPKEKVVSTFREVDDDIKTEEMHEYAERSVWSSIKEFVADAIDTAKEKVEDVIEYAAEKVKDTIDKILHPCYITSAVCKSSGKPDDCYELTQLRKFRDEWLEKQPDGKRLIAQYYNDAPEIVNKINSMPDSDEIYAKISAVYIEPCLRYLENNEPDKCKELYVSMVNDLCRKYVSDEA